jgi:hypothetical protein
LVLVESFNNDDDGSKARERGRERKEREVEDEREGMRRWLLFFIIFVGGYE